MFPRRALVAMIIACFVAVAARAVAEPTSPDRALATELFKEGRALLVTGKVEEACTRFEESQRLDPGGGTLLNLALCHESLGKTATAWSEMTEALGWAKRDRRDDRAQIASAHIAALEPKLARIVVVVSEGGNIEGLTIVRDGSVVSPTVWGLAMPVDPGLHRIIASAPGRHSFAITVDARASETARVEIPRLEDEAAREAEGAPDLLVAPMPPAPQALAPVPPVLLAPRGPSDTGSRTATILGYGLGALGVVSLGAGTGFGIDAINQRKDSDRGCPSSTMCSQPAFDANERAKRSADVSTVMISAGAVALVVGIYLVVTNRTHGDHF